MVPPAMATKRKTKKARRASPRRPTPEDYQMVIEWSAEDGCFVTTLPAWQNAKTHGATVGKATERGRQVLRLLIDSALVGRV
jgi:antitoxin HicB